MRPARGSHRPAGGALDPRRLRRHLGRRAGVQHVQRRSRDARDVADRPDGDGARQPRVRQGLGEPRGAVPEVRRLPHPRRQLRVRRSQRPDAAQAARHHPPTRRIVNVGGVKVGIIGLGNLSSLEGIIEGGNTLGLRPHRRHAGDHQRGPGDARRRSTSRASSRTSASTRTRASPPAPPRTSDQNTAVAIDGVDVIFGGHLHIVLNPPKDLPHIDTTDGHVSGHTVLCHSGAFAKYVGRLDLVVHIADPDRRRRRVGRQGVHLSHHPHRRLASRPTRRWPTCSSRTSSR